MPTPEARRLFAEVEQVYSGVQRVNDLAAALRREGAGTLRVVASAAFAQQLVPRALAQLRAGGVPTRIDYRRVTFDELVGIFLSGRADVGVSMVPAGHPTLSSTLLGRQPMLCVLPPDHPLAGFFGDGDNGAPAIEVHSPVTACAFVQQGLGLALVDAWSVTPAMRAALAVRPVLPAVGLEIWATHSSLAPLPLAGRRFLASVGKVLRDSQPPAACAQG